MDRRLSLVPEKSSFESTTVEWGFCRPMLPFPGLSESWVKSVVGSEEGRSINSKSITNVRGAQKMVHSPTDYPNSVESEGHLAVTLTKLEGIIWLKFPFGSCL